jgi:hypothetical protein
VAIIPQQTGVLEAASFDNLFDKKTGAPSKSSEVTVAFRHVKFGKSIEERRFAARLDYRLRHIKSGAASIPEGDDVVELISRHSQPITAVLLPSDVLEFGTWGIYQRGGEGPMHIDAVTAPQLTGLAIRSFENARDLVRWLKAFYRGRPASERVSVARPPALQEWGRGCCEGQ